MKNLPNIVLISIDTLRYDRVTLPGELAKGIIPVVDEFAANNILCTRAYSASTFTAPANASVFSGLYPVEHGVLDFGGYLSYSGLQVLKSLGYTITAIVTYRIFCSMLKGHFDEVINITDLTQKRTGMAEMVVDNVKKWAERRKPDPFFLFIHLEGPHAPYRVPKHTFDCLKDVYNRMTPVVKESMVVDANASYQKKFAQFRNFIRKVNRFGIRLRDQDLAGIKTFYDAQAKYHDDNLGEILQILRHKKLLEESAIVIYSDHGEGLFEHGKFGHGCGTIHEEIIKTLFAFSFPGYQGSLLIHHPVSHVQIFPTILDYVGANSKLFPVQRSLIGPISGRDKYLAQIFSEERYKVTVIKDNMKLIRYKPKAYAKDISYAKFMLKMTIESVFHGTPYKELYDLGEDPNETKNLSKIDRDKVDHLEQLLTYYFALRDRGKKEIYRLELFNGELIKQPEMDAYEKERLEEQLRALGYM